VLGIKKHYDYVADLTNEQIRPVHRFRKINIIPLAR